MRARISLVISEDLLAKVDAIAVDKQKRSAVIERAIREFIAREESKIVKETVISATKAELKLYDSSKT